MSNPYSSFCEDFYINMRLGSQMALPHARETVLHFFERVQKQYPAMTRFRRNDGEVSLEEDREKEGYRWLSLGIPAGSRQATSIPSPSRRPSSFHQFVLELAPTTWASARSKSTMSISSSASTSSSAATTTRSSPRRCSRIPPRLHSARSRCQGGRFSALLHRRSF